MSELLEKRKKAFQWWGSNRELHAELTAKYFGSKSPDLLTGREIQIIWQREGSQLNERRIP